MMPISILSDILQNIDKELSFDFQEETLIIHNNKDLLSVGECLKNHPDLQFESLQDIAAVDYLYYGMTEWTTDKATGKGFDRAVDGSQKNFVTVWNKPRFALSYHLLSYQYNKRLRLKLFIDENRLMVDSVVSIWPSANWYEREAFDLYGVLFEHHPDMRRILTDYGFIGHPFRKDFPVSGTVQVRYDEQQKRVIYEPVDIVPRILVPKVIREKEQQEEPHV